MYSRELLNESDFMLRRTSELFECFLCGEKFDSELSKDLHMENCVIADGPNSLDSSYDPTVRALLRQSPNHGVWAYRSPPHLAPNPTPQKSDFSSAVGSRMTAQPLIPQGYPQSESPDEDMRRRIQYPPKPKYPISSPITNNPHIAQYVQEGAKTQLFRNMNIQTTQFQPRVPQYPLMAPPPPPQSTAPFGYSRSSQLMYTPRAPPPLPESAPFISTQAPHAVVTRISSGPRIMESETMALLTQNTPADLSSSNLVTRNDRRESSQHDGNLTQLVVRHNHPVANPPPPPQQILAAGPAAEVAKRGKFEAKLVWEKQQPTLETTLEYLDNVDTEQILLKWDSRKETFSASARLSPGEHTGSLAIPDTELVVYEVHPFNVSQYSVSVQEIKLDLVDIAPRYNLPPEPTKRPLYSQIDVHSKHLTTNKRFEDLKPQKYLSEHKEVHPKPFQIVREERRATLPVSAALRTNLSVQEFHSLPQEESISHPANRPIAPLKYREELSRQDISEPIAPSFQLMTEERRVPLTELQREQPVPRSTQTGQEERNRVEFRIPAGEQPLPPPRNKPAATADKSREEAEYKKQIDGIIVKLKEELTKSRAEREEVERTLGAEARKWQSNYENLYKLKQTRDNENDILTREIDQMKQFVSVMTQRQDKSTDRDRVGQLEERTAALLREKEEANRNRDEVRTKQQLAEKRNKELEGKIHDLLDESQKKIQNIQMERDSYKAAAYRYKSERDRVKMTHEGERTTYEELKNVHQQLKDDYERKITDTSYQINTLTDKLKQAEAFKYGNYTHNNNNKDLSINNTERHTTEPMRSGFNDRGYMSLGSMESDQKKGFDKGEYFSKDNFQDKKPVPAKKPSTISEYGATSKVNSDYLREHVSPTQPPPAPSATKNYTRKASVHNRVQELEGRNAEPPKAPPRFPRAQSNKVEGLVSYRPELLTSFIQKHTPVFYKSSSISATRLSYFKKPETHMHKQVLVKVRDIYRLGTLQVIFSKRYSFPVKTLVIAGVRLEEPAGNSNGIYEGMRYFECEHNQALFPSVEEVFIHVA